mgnify:CR=1 FL=1
MKFEVLSSDLMSRLNAISRVLSSKNALPILENFLFEVGENKLTVTASDGDSTMITTIDIQNGEGQGKFVVPAKTIIDPLKEMPQQQLLIEVDNGNYEVIVRYSTGKYNFIGGDAAAYPVLKALEAEAKEFEMNPQGLLNGVTCTLFATAEDDLRPVMNGVYFDIKTDRVVFVASDSKKLVRLVNDSVTTNFEGAFILPKKPATLLKGIIGKFVSKFLRLIERFVRNVAFEGFNVYLGAGKKTKQQMLFELWILPDIGFEQLLPKGDIFPKFVCLVFEHRPYYLLVIRKINHLER